MSLNSLEDLLVEEMKDIYSAENQLVKALPKMAKAASHPELQAAFEKHLEETKVHVERIEKAMEKFDASPRGKRCEAMAGLIEEGEEILKQEGANAVKDAALISAAQKVEHYEISAYGSARALAQVLGRENLVEILTETLDEESQTDSDLTAIAETIHSEAFAEQ
jgi:ferritin-like metal-binding protein YciE